MRAVSHYYVGASFLIPTTIISNKKYIRIVRILLDAGADMNLSTEDGYTALVFAVRMDNEPAVKLLLDAGADVDATGAVNKQIDPPVSRIPITPLMVAVDNRNISIMKLLLKAGADVNKVDAEGNTALIKAVKNSRKWLPYGPNLTYMELKKEQDKIVEFLLKEGADVNKVDAEGNTALMISKENSTIEGMLIDAGALAPITNNAGVPFGKTNRLSEYKKNHQVILAQPNIPIATPIATPVIHSL